MSETEDQRPVIEVERRSAARHPCDNSPLIRLTVRPGLRTFRGLLWDVSRDGISFHLHRPLEKGSVLTLVVRGSAPGVSCSRSAHVVHSTPAEGLWLIGCRVSPPFGDHELEGLV